ncbi:hypothetical protein FEZ43_14170 [Lacticaseibacillus rhamnosus]|nr:hypothetical protein PY66_05535 [Lacticaseibacillus rhamnosus]OAU76652.1 hypothetical protein PY74_06730 [Lacticaseibacillus rhamnosus]TLQ22290.1 hypothetical protein FEZ43_14170 [Lacticaseibacillus rhamnosus]
MALPVCVWKKILKGAVFKNRQAVGAGMAARALYFDIDWCGVRFVKGLAIDRRETTRAAAMSPTR